MKNPVSPGIKFKFQIIKYKFQKLVIFSDFCGKKFVVQPYFFTIFSTAAHLLGASLGTKIIASSPGCPLK